MIRAPDPWAAPPHIMDIFMRPPNSDWNAIADETGDPSWRAVAMQAYFQKILNIAGIAALGVSPTSSLAGRINPTGHGFGGRPAASNGHS